MDHPLQRRFAAQWNYERHQIDNSRRTCPKQVEYRHKATDVRSRRRQRRGWATPSTASPDTSGAAPGRGVHAWISGLEPFRVTVDSRHAARAGTPRERQPRGWRRMRRGLGSRVRAGASRPGGRKKPPHLHGVRASLAALRGPLRALRGLALCATRRSVVSRGDAARAPRPKPRSGIRSQAHRGARGSSRRESRPLRHHCGAPAPTRRAEIEAPGEASLGAAPPST